MVQPAVNDYSISIGGVGDGDINSGNLYKTHLFDIPGGINNLYSYSITASAGIVKRSDDGGDDGGITMYLWDGNPGTLLATHFFPSTLWGNSSSDSYTTIINYTIPQSQLSESINKSIWLGIEGKNVTDPSAGFDTEDWRYNGYSTQTSQYPSPGSQPTNIINSSIWVSLSFL